MELNHILQDLEVTEQFHSPTLSRARSAPIKIGAPCPRATIPRSPATTTGGNLSESTTINSQPGSPESTVPKEILAMHSNYLQNAQQEAPMARFVRNKALRLITQMNMFEDDEAIENFPFVCGDSPSFMEAYRLLSPSCAARGEYDDEEKGTSPAVHCRSIAIESPLTMGSPTRQMSTRRPTTPPRHSSPSSSHDTEGSRRTGSPLTMWTRRPATPPRRSSPNSPATGGSRRSNSRSLKTPTIRSPSESTLSRWVRDSTSVHEV